MKALLLLTVAAAALGLPALADAPPAKSYAQALVERTVAAHPDIAVLALHVTPPKSADNVIIASNIGRIGKKADEDDLRVIKTGTPNKAVNKTGDRYEVELPLLDANHRRIGAAGIVFAYKAGDDKAKLDREAETIRDALARRISHVGNLVEPATYDAAIPAQSYGQALVDHLLDKHPNLVILALHAPTASNADYPIVASNIGRLGKKADEDDMHVITSGEPKLEFNDTKDRYEVEEPLLDSTGMTIGAVGVVFAYKKGDDLAARKKEADTVQAELKEAIPSAAKLVEAKSETKSGGDYLKKIGFTELPGYEGDFDHIMADQAGNRLLLAAEDHGTLELFELSSLKHLKTLTGVETPHAFLPLPAAKTLVVTDSGKGGSKLFDLATLQPKGSLKNLGLGADSLEYDAKTGHAFINTGGKDADMKEAFLEEIDPVSGKEVAKVKFASNSLQGLALDPDGSRVFVMDQGNNTVAVVDRATHQITQQWPIKNVGQAAMVQYDAAHHRVIVATRKPGRLIVLNADSGAEIANLAGPERADQLIYDAASGRVYMLGGEGAIGLYQQSGADGYSELARIPTVEGAKTGLLVPELHRLFVAVSPGEGKSSGGGLLEYDVE